jgi:Uncharacterized protein conserved in archaea
VTPVDPQQAQPSDEEATAVLMFPYSTTSAAQRVANAIAPETNALDDARSQVTLARDNQTVELRVHATDRTALRASLNTWFKLVEVAEHAGDATSTASR